MAAEALAQLHELCYVQKCDSSKVQGLEKGVSENEAPGPVGAYTTTHNDTITLMPNLIHRISFTELKFECRTRVAEGTSAGRSTLRHNRTHAPTGPRRARTYMRI